MIEHVPQQIDKAFLYFHSAGTSSEELNPFLNQLVDHLPNTYIWAGDGVISQAPLMRQGLFYGPDAKHYWFTFPMQDASSPESFASHVEALGATLSCAGAYVNALVDQVMARFHLTAQQVVLCGFQHGSCVALAAAMMRKCDPYTYTILFEPYILESYYLRDEAPLTDTTVVCIDNRHIRTRIQNWMHVETDREFQSYGMITQRITVEEGDDNLNAAMVDEAVKIVKQIKPHLNHVEG
jgi:predicted esterase